MSTLITTTLQGINTVKYDGSTTAMTIDSSGRVTNPNIPYIFVDMDNGGSAGYETVANGSKLPFRNVISSRGGMTLDTSNHYVTIPVTGIYQVNCQVLNNNSETLEFGLYNSNGAAYQARFYDVTTRSINIHQAMPFTASDQISVFNTVGNNLGIHRNAAASDRYTMLSMHLIG